MPDSAPARNFGPDKCFSYLFVGFFQGFVAPDKVQLEGGHWPGSGQPRPGFWLQLQSPDPPLQNEGLQGQIAH